MKFALSILMIFWLGSCTLAENKKLEESKDYVDQVHEVELVDYEFEERLNSFYESEPIQNEELYTLYDGEFPEEERNPQKLRIYWKDARELALAELELQKSIQTGWDNATISERPILVLDRDGGDFYRYYEYRVVRDKKFLGAIRIPAYRRTENFATAEVHLYSADEKTYTIHPTGWNLSIAKNMKFNENSQFMQNIQKQIGDNISDNLAFTYAVNMIKSSPELMPNKNISLSKSDDMFYKDLGALVDHDPWVSQMQGRMEGKGHVIEPAKRNMTKYNKQTVSGELANTMNLITLYNMAQKVSQESKEMLKYLGTVKYLEIYSAVIQNNFLFLALNEKKTTLDNILVSYFWDVIEKNITSKTIGNIHQHWNYDTLFDIYNVQPVLNYIPAEDIERHISSKRLSEFLTPSLDLFLANDNVKISLTESIRFRNAGNRLRSSVPDFGSREEAIAFLDTQIKLKLQQSADSVNDATALTLATFKEGANYIFNIGMGGKPPKPIENIFGSSDPNTGIIGSISIGAGAAVAGGASTILATVTSIAVGGGVVLAVAGFAFMIKAAIELPNYFSDKALKERDNQFDIFDEEVMSNDKGLGAVINDIMKQFEDKGWEPLNSSDGKNIDFILEYRSTSSEEERRQLFYKRLYREMAIRCNRWWMKKAVNGNYIHSSWDTGSFVPIPEQFIVNNGAYCHIKGDISDNPKE